MVETTDRAAVGALITMPEFVDVIVPRGGKSLIERVSRDAKVPVIKHLDGVCHVFIDIAADLDKAIRIADNAKTHRYAPCNTMETLLVHVGIAERVLPPLAAIYRDKSVELRGCERTRALLGADVIEATEQDWYTEYTAPILSIRIVDDLDQAIEHINTYGSKHTDAIVSEHFSDARRFLNEVDSASVMVNASTRFADGFEYGLGAEIGISTDKLHARGPVGLEGLTSEKYVVFGDGHVAHLMTKRIGLLGGTFDPVHIGHLRSALEVADALALDELRLLPNFRPPHRDTPQVAAEQRLEMVRVAVEGISPLVVDDRELKRDKPSYTIDTLELMRAELAADDPLFLLLGWDAFCGLPSWHRWEELLQHCHILVLQRPDADSEPRGCLAQPAGRAVGK